MKELPSAAELVRELVAVPSVSGEEGRVAALVAERLGDHGVEPRRVGASVFARVPLGDVAGPRFLLLSHLDTVPVGEGWTRDPYAARWEDGVLYGRGANDAKASAGAMLWAFLESARRPPPGARGELWLALVASEETDNSGARAVLAETGLPDGAVTGEPTGLEVVRAQAGLAVLTATWEGRSCHAAHVARVDHANALLAAAREIAGLPAFLALDPPHELLGASTIAPTVLHAGARHNVVPDRAELVLDARLAPPHDAEAARARVARHLPGARVAVRSARLGAVETAADHPLVRAALACASRARAIGSTTLSDMALLAGIPAVKCGPGDTRRSHTPDEHVRRAEVDAGARFYLELIPAALGALAAAGAPHAAEVAR